MEKNFSKAKILRAVDGCNGVVDVVAARLGCAWATARKYIQKYPEAVAALELEDSKFCKLVSERIVSAIRRGDKWALERAADSKARRVGFGIVQRQEIDHTTGGERIIPKIEVVFVDAKGKK